jgi:hypothetical protein
MKQAISALFLVTMCVTLLTRPAYAYLDPGTASLLLQGVIGAAAAGGAVVSLNYNRVKSKLSSWFGRNGGKQQD